MSSKNYKGSIVSKIYNAVEQHPEMTMGEILYSFLYKKALNKNFVEATDEEIYNSLEKWLKTAEEDDEPFDEQGWNFWEQKVICKK